MEPTKEKIIFSRIFITVGSFEFTELIEKFLMIETFDSIFYDQLIIQYGQGISPKQSNPDLNFIEVTDEFQKDWKSISCNFDIPLRMCFNFYRNPTTFIKLATKADLVITHGGAGTLLDLIRNVKGNTRILTISNPTLMNQHQVHIIQKLKTLKCIDGGIEDPSHLTKTLLLDIALSHTHKLPPPNTNAFLIELETLTGYPFK